MLVLPSFYLNDVMFAGVFFPRQSGWQDSPGPLYANINGCTKEVITNRARMNKKLQMGRINFVFTAKCNIVALFFAQFSAFTEVNHCAKKEVAIVAGRSEMKE